MRSPTVWPARYGAAAIDVLMVGDRSLIENSVKNDDMFRRSGPDRRSAILDAAIGVIARTGRPRLPRRAGWPEQAGVAVSLPTTTSASRNGLVRRDARPRQRARRHDRAQATGLATVEATLLAELDEDARATRRLVWGEVLASAMFEAELRDQLRDATVVLDRSRGRGDRGRSANGSIPAASRRATPPSG